MSKPNGDVKQTLGSKFAVGWIAFLLVTASSVYATYGTTISKKWIPLIVVGFAGALTYLAADILTDFASSREEKDVSLLRREIVFTYVAVGALISLLASSFLRGIGGAHPSLLETHLTLSILAVLAVNLHHLFHHVSDILKKVKRVEKKPD